MRFALLLLVSGLAAAQGVVVVGQPESDEGTGFVDTLHVDADPAARFELSEVVARALGANLRRTGGEGRPAYLALRGGTAEQLAVFLDDIPLHGSRGGTVDLSTLPAAYFDRVEVLRGPAAARYGGRAQGGVLKLRTRRIEAGREGFVRMQLGSASLARTDGAVVTPGLLAAGAVSASEGDFGFEDSQGNVRRRLGNDHRRGSGLVRGRLGPWTLLVEGTAGDRGEPGSDLVDPAPDARTRDTRVQGGLGWDGAAGPVNLGARMFARRQTHRFTDPDAVLGPTDARLTDQLYGGRVSGGWPVGRHAPWVALEGRHERGGAVRTTTAAVVGERWRAFDWLRLGGAFRLSDTDERDAAPMAEGGVELGPWAGFSVRANLGRIFRDPSFDELHFVGQGVEGNPALRPEDGVGGDAGVRWRLPRRLTLELVYFEQRYERLILWVPVNAYTIRPSDDFGATVRGVEAGAAARVGVARVDLTYTWMQHAFDHATEAPLPFRPRHALGLQVSARMGSALVFGGGRWRGAVHTDRFGHRTLPGYASWDLGLRGPVVDGLDVGLELRNVTDEQGRDAVHRPLPGRTWLFTMSLAP